MLRRRLPGMLNLTLRPPFRYAARHASCSHGSHARGGGWCFFFNDTATTEIYTLSLHDALPIWTPTMRLAWPPIRFTSCCWTGSVRSEEHTSELQSRPHLVCRLLLEKKKNQ